MEVANRLNRIDAAHTAKDHNTTKREYDSFHEYLAQERAHMIGEFRGVQFTDAVASYGIDRVARYDDDCSGLVVFIVIEIFIA